MTWPPPTTPTGGKTNATPQINDHPQHHNDIAAWISDAAAQITANRDAPAAAVAAEHTLNSWTSGITSGRGGYVNAFWQGGVVVVQFYFTGATAGRVNATLVPTAIRPPEDVWGFASIFEPTSGDCYGTVLAFLRANGEVQFVQHNFGAITPDYTVGAITYHVGMDNGIGV